MGKHLYIVWDAGRANVAYKTRRAAKIHRLRATCGRCWPQKSCPHYAESFIIKVGYSTDIKSVLKQEEVKKCRWVKSDDPK